MSIGRRQFLHLTAAAAAMPAVSRTAYADTYLCYAGLTGLCTVLAGDRRPPPSIRTSRGLLACAYGKCFSCCRWVSSLFRRKQKSFKLMIINHAIMNA